MYWPIGTPRIYATSSSRAPACRLVVSHDGLSSPLDSSLAASPAFPSGQPRGIDDDLLPPPTPVTPSSPKTPRIESVEHDDDGSTDSRPESRGSDVDDLPLKDPVLAMRISRSGNLFAVITATSITVWQTKV